MGRIEERNNGSFETRSEVIGGALTEERRYCLSSLEADAEGIGKAVRAHWGIENGLHWVLDVNFREDYAGNRKRHSAENMASLRHMAKKRTLIKDKL
jgi:predicted transposase YbfD/YdcC